MLDVKARPDADAEETATYIHDMAVELARLAERRDFDFLAYLLTMAADEAGTLAETQAEVRQRRRRIAGHG